jgi:hypothetical protein
LEIERLRVIERQAIEQSEHIQKEWLSPMEAAGLRVRIMVLEKRVYDLDDVNEFGREVK